MFSAVANYISNGISYSNPSQVTLTSDQASQTSIAHVVGMWLGRLLGTRTDHIEEKPLRKFSRIAIDGPTNFTAIYEQLFSDKRLNVFYIELDPGVDDGACLLQLLAATKTFQGLPINGLSIQGIAASVGNVIRSQAELNTLQFLELTQSQNIPVYPGAVAPLAIENNTAAIYAMAQKINATHFYGFDGEQDIGGWPNVTTSVQAVPGYLQAASAIAEASNPLTLVSTAALTELSKTLTQLVENDPQGNFASNIKAITIRGGCLDPKVGCNAPYFMPDDKKNSELSFFFDVPAAQNVFAICQKFNIPIILCPLDLTQQPGLLWTKEQVSTLQKINNAVANQMALLTNIVPYPYARHFPADTFPMHDLFAAAALLYPDFFNATQVALSIGDVGQILINSNATAIEQNVYILSMPEEKQAFFYDTILKEYEKFTCLPGSKAAICKPKLSLDTILEIAIPTGVGTIGLMLGFAALLHRRRMQMKNREVARKDRQLNEKSQLLEQRDRTLAQTSGLLNQIDSELVQTSGRLTQTAEELAQKAEALAKTERELAEKQRLLEESEEHYQKVTQIVMFNDQDQPPQGYESDE